MKKIYFNFIIILLLLITSKLTYADFIILQTGWNMFSLHVNTTINANDLKTRCGTNVNIWNYQNGRYVEATEIKPGFGYWIKLSSNCDISLEGGDVSINNLPQLKAGWNQVGGLSSSVSFDSIKGNCVKTAGPWRYNPSTRRYESASSLESGYGYWIKVASDCRLETQICSDVTAYGSCSSTKPKYCDNGNLINKCSHCGCPTYSSCNITSEDCHTTTVTECTPGNNMIKQTDYPSGSCLTSTTYKWSNVPCANSKVCKEGLCKLVDADLTSYTLPSGKYARSDTISIPYRIKNVGEIQWCFLTETQLTKSDTAKIWSGKTNSISSTSSYTDLLYHSLSCSDPLGTWSGLLYSYTDTIANGGWKVWGTPSYNIQVVECLNDQDCVNCLGSDYKCNTTTNKCYTPIVFTCSDGTVYGSCSSTKPKYCSSGTLINKCSQCGCPTGYTCQTDGSCKSVVSTGTIWGANLYVPKFSDSNPSGYAASYLSNTVFQAAKDMGITHIILWQKNFNEGVNGIKPAPTITQAQMVDAVTRMKNYGLQPIIVLDYDVDKAVALVTALGSNCTMYEVCKEPHVSGSSCYADEATYASRWNEVVSACREVNPNAMYGGPAVGSIPGTSPRSETWMRKWLEQCDGDFVSVHAFYDPIDSKSNIVSRARTEVIEDVAFLKDILADYGKQSLPIVYSEVQWTAAVTTNGWDMDQTFNDDFANSLMSTMEEQDVYAAMFWTLIGYNNNFAIIRPPSQSYEKKPQYYSIQDYLTGVTNTCTSCGSWTSGSCNVGGCVNQRQQTRTCTPAGCMPTDGLGTSRCVADTSCGVATIYAGFRSSPYGYQTQQTPTWWVNMAKGMSAKVPNSAPTIIWILGEILAPGNLCKLYFPSPGGSYTNIIFNSNDVAEQYLSAFDTNGIKVWLQVEPGDADVTQLIDLVLNRYSHHSSIIGFGVDVEWYKYSTNNNEDSPGKAVTDTEAQTWLNKVKSYNSNYKLFLKHWLTNKMPPTFRNADLVFINDGQDLGSLQNMINEFKAWGNSFSSSSVGFQFGYPSDKSWWSQLSDPEGQIANTLISNIPNTKGVYWVDFSITDILCSDNTLYGSCSATKPKYCSSGTLIDKCSTCGCSTGQTCQADGSCKSVVSTGTIVSTELINFYGMTTSEVQTFIQLIDNQNIPLLIARLNAMDEFQSGTSSGITKIKQVIQEANLRGIQVAVDLHTWYTTWDNYFRDSVSNHDTYRSQYITYVRNVLSAFSDSNVYSFMVMNEPQARTATSSENQFIIDVINAAKEVTDRPISVRFMGGYSPSTGHYSLQIDQISDYLCRNVYWDPRQPGVSVYGTTEEKINTAISTAHNQGKELWITEFGKSKSNLEEQRAYVEAFVSWSKNKSVDAIFCWVSQPEGGSGESYNIFTDYTPHPAFYELVND